MGPFQEYEEKKSPEKGSPRSRIPRLVLHPFHPKEKASPQSDSPFSEEEGKDCDVSSDHSKRTISSNSFCSDDTGCPTSQSVSPSKTPSGSERSTRDTPALPECKTKVKRVRVMAEWTSERQTSQRNKREMRSALKPKGCEADSSSSSHSTSRKTRESLNSNSAGKKVSPGRSTNIRPPIFKPAGSASANHDVDLYAPYKAPPRAWVSYSSSSNSSPTSGRANLSRYHSCEGNHGIRPPNPEQYLTPLQQKEVIIRHLNTKWMESKNKVHNRETVIEALKGQLSRMREDWIEAECHRLEAELSLKEARKEIRHLRQVVETMKNSLMEKDTVIQKLKLLQSMALAQSGSNLQEENTLDLICGDGKKMPDEDEGGMEMGEQGAEAMADSGLLLNDEMANRADILEQVLMSTAVDFSQDSSGKMRPDVEGCPGVSSISEGSHLSDEYSLEVSSNPAQKLTEDKEVQADVAPVSPDLQVLLLQLLQGAKGAMLSPPNLPSNATFCLPAPLDTPSISADSGMSLSEPSEKPRFMEELDFDTAAAATTTGEGSASSGLVEKSYWSNSFLVGLVAFAAPVLPTVAWLYSRHGVDGNAPVYNIATLIRGCSFVRRRTPPTCNGS